MFDHHHPDELVLVMMVEREPHKRRSASTGSMPSTSSFASPSLTCDRHSQEPADKGIPYL
jgi:hypothetical protein